MAGTFPTNRVQDILKRMDDNTTQPEAIKTCFGILAIMSRDEQNKMLIAKDGMELIFNAMTAHVDKYDVQESGCDLLWSLAFNNGAVKDFVAKHGGSGVLVRALKRHSRYADFLKSACGALSNICQCRQNQEGIASHGGLQPLVGSIHVHQTNAKLLPFIFDALASLIVSNEDNSRTVSSLGLIPLIISSLSRHKSMADVIKSGCHTLAILTDVKGQANKIALAGGVSLILSLLDQHPSYADLHRVAAVVLLRMLQESSNVGREIACNEGVRILLKSIDKGGAQQDTVAAVTHILFSITNPSSPVASVVESQLWLATRSVDLSTVGQVGLKPGGTSSELLVSIGGKQFARPQGSSPLKGIGAASASTMGYSRQSLEASSGAGSGCRSPSETALGGLVKILNVYAERRDVVRAACRLLNNLSYYPGVPAALERLHILDRVLECASIHNETRDVLDASGHLLKTVNAGCLPMLRSTKPSCLRGLLNVFHHKAHDEEAVTACAIIIAGKLEDSVRGDRVREVDDFQGQYGRTLQAESMACCNRTIDKLLRASGGNKELAASSDANANSNGANKEVAAATAAAVAAVGIGSATVGSTSLTDLPPVNGANQKKAQRQWTKFTHGYLQAVFKLIEYCCIVAESGNPTGDECTPYKSCASFMKLLSHNIPVRFTELTDRLEYLSPRLQRLGNENRDKNDGGAAFTISRDVSADDRLSTQRPSSTGSGSKHNALPPAAAKDGHFDAQRISSDCAEKDQDRIDEGNHANESKAEGKRGEGGPGSTRSPAGTGGVESTSGDRGLGGKPMSSRPPGYAAPRDRFKRPSPMAGREANKSPSPSLESSEANENVIEELPPIVDEVLCEQNNRKYTKYYPRHPCRNPLPSGPVKGSTFSTGSHLVEQSPGFLEKLSPTSSTYCAHGSAYANYHHDVVDGDRLHVVYEGGSAAGKGIHSRCPQVDPYDVPAGGNGAPFEHSLTFDSEFESGNLYRAVQRDDAVYDLFLRADVHTAGHTQWFYFAVSNTHPPSLVKMAAMGVPTTPLKVRFNIVNFTKPDSLFNLGMRPCVYSYHDSLTKGLGWSRLGTEVSYFQNSYERSNNAGEGDRCFYTLSFCLEFSHAKDTTLIAYSYPYTYADHKHHLSRMLSRPGAHGIIRQSKLCTTLGGENCDLVTITNFEDRDKERIGPITFNDCDGLSRDDNQRKATTRELRALKLKPAIVFSGRVHPGESPASWMMKGILDFLTGPSPAAQLIRQEFVVYVVPMLNPDGVILGNNRCSLAGVDLNRQWKMPHKSLHPTVHHLKSFMMFQSRIRTVGIYVDLHGHSRKHNVFMYGCEDKKKSRMAVKAFPKYLAQHEVGGKYINFGDCSFSVKKGREATARVVVAREMNIPNSFTLEATFSGTNYGPLKYCHMNVEHMQEVGSSLCDAYLNFAIADGLVKDQLNAPVGRSSVSPRPSGFSGGYAVRKSVTNRDESTSAASRLSKPSEETEQENTRDSDNKSKVDTPGYVDKAAPGKSGSTDAADKDGSDKIAAEFSEKEDEGGEDADADADVESDSGGDSDDPAAVGGMAPLAERIESVGTSDNEREAEKAAMESADKFGRGLQNSPSRTLIDGIATHVKICGSPGPGSYSAPSTAPTRSTHPPAVMREQSKDDNERTHCVSPRRVMSKNPLPVHAYGRTHSATLSATFDAMNTVSDNIRGSYDYLSVGQRNNGATDEFPSLENINAATEKSLLKLKSRGNGNESSSNNIDISRSTTDLSVLGSRIECDGIAGSGLNSAAGGTIDDDGDNDSVLESGSVVSMREGSISAAPTSQHNRKKKTKKATQHHKRRGKGRSRSRAGSVAGAGGRGAAGAACVPLARNLEDDSDSGGDSDIEFEGSIADGNDSLDEGSVTHSPKSGVNNSNIISNGSRSMRSLAENGRMKSGELVMHGIGRKASTSADSSLVVKSSATMNTGANGGVGNSTGSRPPSNLYEERMAMMQTVKSSSANLKAGGAAGSLGSALSIGRVGVGGGAGGGGKSDSPSLLPELFKGK